MSRPRSPNRDEAFRLFKESSGRLSSAEIASLLNEKINNINTWRVKDKWTNKVGKKGAPYGNKNAVGNSGGGDPEANQNHYINGFYSKYFPKKVVSILELTKEMEPIDILWTNIQLSFATIINSQKIMFVKDHDDLTKEIKKTISEKKIKATEGIEMGGGEYKTYETYREEEYELQFAWDKQATFMNAQSKAMGQLTNMIWRYEEMLNNNWDIATEEQKLRIQRLKTQIQNPVLQHQKEHSKEKLQLERERFEYQKEMGELKQF